MANPFGYYETYMPEGVDEYNMPWGPQSRWKEAALPSLAGLQRTAKGFMDPATGKVYSSWNASQTPGVDQYLYDPTQGLIGGSTQGDTLRYRGQPAGTFQDDSGAYYLTEGYDPSIDVTAPVHDSYGTGDAFMDYATGPLGMAVGAAFLPGLLGGPEGALSGADLSVFDYPTLTGAEAATYGAPTAGYTGGVSYLANAVDGAGTLSSVADVVNDSLGNIVQNTSGGVDYSGFDYPTLTSSEAITYGAPTSGYTGGVTATDLLTSGATTAATTGTSSDWSAGDAIDKNQVYNTGGGTTGGGLLSSLLGLTGNDALVADAFGRLFPSLVGAWASSNQSDAMRDLANQYTQYGAPSRSRFEQSMTAGFDPNTIPGYRASVDDAMNSQMRALSTTGNPFGNPGGLIEAQKKVIAGTAMPAINEYQRMNAGAGGLASLNAAVPGMQSSAIQGDTGMWNALGYGIDQAMNPRRQQSLAELMRSYTVPA